MADIATSEIAGCGIASVLARGPVNAGAGVALLPVAPGQWLAIGDNAAPDWAETLAQALPDAAMVDQSGAYVVVHLAGSDARRLLQKGLSVDLDLLAPGAVVVSAIAHIGVIVRHTAPDAFDILVFRSFAASFRDWLDTAIAAL